MLSIVPTPIGNYDDMTFRAINVLKEVDLILAEDTRVTRKLLTKFGINTPLESFHSHNEHKRLDGIIDRLKAGAKIALVSDAGTPGISDPGFLLARACVAEQIDITCLPGATAFVPALVMSGFPCDKFYFEGFLPHKKGRQTRLKAILEMEVTVVLYESPYRIVKLLKQIDEMGYPDKKVSISREISKMYEETVRGTVRALISDFDARTSIKGEFVVILKGNS